MIQPSLRFRALNAIRIGYQFHGIWFPFVMLHRFSLYAFRKLFTSQTFIFAGKKYDYSIHPFILDSERTVEVAIACEFLRNKSGLVLELGNVLSNYRKILHDVVDKYELTPGVINEDIVLFSPSKKYDAIVTISTLEHVGWDETPRTPEKILQAIEHLKHLLADGGEILATVPIGYNSYFDQVIREQRTGFTDVKFLVRTTANNQWREASFNEAITKQYGKPYSCANAVMVGTFRRQ